MTTLNFKGLTKRKTKRLPTSNLFAVEKFCHPALTILLSPRNVTLYFSRPSTSRVNVASCNGKYKWQNCLGSVDFFFFLDVHGECEVLEVSPVLHHRRGHWRLTNTQPESSATPLVTSQSLRFTCQTLTSVFSSHIKQIKNEITARVRAQTAVSY